MTTANTQERQQRRVWTHPAFVIGVMTTCVVLGLLPLQYIPVLPRHDREFLALGLAPLAIGAAIAARCRPRKAGRSVVAASGALIAAVVLCYRLYGGIGWPDALDLAIALVLVAGPVSAVAWLSRHRGRTITVVATVGSILITSVGLAVFAAVQEPVGPEQRCVERNGIEYCYFDGYGPFVDRWAPAVAGVLRRLPDEVRADAPSVVQTHDEALRQPLATPFLDWDRPGSGTAELALALDTANWALGVNPQFKGRTGLGGRLCTPRLDDGRSIVAFWLAGQATPEGGRALRGLNEFADSITGSEYAAPVVGNLEAAGDAVRLLQRPADEVGRLVIDHWATLSDPAVTTEKAQEILGLPTRQPVQGVDGSDARFYTQDCQ